MKLLFRSSICILFLGSTHAKSGGCHSVESICQESCCTMKWQCNWKMIGSTSCSVNFPVNFDSTWTCVDGNCDDISWNSKIIAHCTGTRPLRTKRLYATICDESKSGHGASIAFWLLALLLTFVVFVGIVCLRCRGSPSKTHSIDCPGAVVAVVVVFWVAVQKTTKGVYDEQMSYIPKVWVHHGPVLDGEESQSWNFPISNDDE